MHLKVNRIEFAYASREVLRGISFDASAGEVLGILGHNGCGKTTLLKCINTSLKPKRGRVSVDGQNVMSMSKKEIAKRMAFVTQSTNFTFPFTVYETVMMGRYSRIDSLGNETEKDIEIVYKAMAETGTLQFMDRDIGELSGGERRRVMIARALVQEPDILLLDEPTLHLDINHQFELMDLITRLAREKSLLVVFVTHDIVFAARYCDRLIIMEKGEIVAAGSVENTVTPENLRNFFGIEAEVTEDNRFGLNVLMLGKAESTTDWKKSKPPDCTVSH